MIEDQDINGWAYKGSSRTLLTDAASGGDLELTKRLLAHADIDVNLIDGIGQTALHATIFKRQTKIIEILLQHPNLDPNRRDKNGWTPLLMAADAGYVEAITLLLAHPATDPSLTLRGATALNWAADCSHEAAFALLKDAEQAAMSKPTLKPAFMAPANLAVCRHEDVNGRTCEGSQTNLTEAAYKGNLDSARQLLAHPDIKVNLLDGFGNSALYTAISNRHIHIVEILMQQQDIDPNQRNSDGWTPLMKAGLNGYVEAIALLISHPKTDPLLSLKGNKAYNWAYSNSHETAIALLKDAEQAAELKNLKHATTVKELESARQNAKAAIEKNSISRHLESIKKGFLLAETFNEVIWVKRGMPLLVTFSAAVGAVTGQTRPISFAIALLTSPLIFQALSARGVTITNAIDRMITSPSRSDACDYERS